MMLTGSLVLAGLFISARSVVLEQTAYTAPGTFPTSVFRAYYNDPTGTKVQVQPKISDPVSVCSFYLVFRRPQLI